MKYLRLTPLIPLTLESDDVLGLKWWVDESYYMHIYYWSHTGDTSSLVKGYPYSKLSKQNMNTKSSTKAELVGIDDMMPMIQWVRYFMGYQGYHITDNIVYQDNQSTMLLSRNGKYSSRKRTKHISIRYFFVTDIIDNEDIPLEFSPTDYMIGDFFPKPTQGSLFCKF